MPVGKGHKKQKRRFSATWPAHLSHKLSAQTGDETLIKRGNGWSNIPTPILQQIMKLTHIFGIISSKVQKDSEKPSRFPSALELKQRAYLLLLLRKY